MPNQLKNQNNEPAAITALHELEAVASTPEDYAELAKWKKEIGKERAKAVSGLGKEAVNFVQVDNAMYPEAEVKQAIADGHEVGPTKPDHE